ncbi:TIM-barrel domain-containing protein [uncultured Celeribacter sp.]|uniref:TIM-barrel domain-containing protein n=1 Tax=uncultured Celeribacter sp. TaxID=1303376 RepID=UPI002AA60C16|nr:TIM-barrel domain-containing protein [uncultured Celeribacter sp.]
MTDRTLPASWKPYNTYDYVPIDEWTVGDDIDLFAVSWDGKPHSPRGFDKDWTVFINARARTGAAHAKERDICLVLQVTSCEKNAFRIRFSPAISRFEGFADKVYGPIVKDRLDQIREYEKRHGIRPNLRWNRNGVFVALRSISVEFVRGDDDHLSIQIRRHADGAITDISSGPLLHADPAIGTVANLKRKADGATHYFGLGEILHYNMTSSNDPEFGASEAGGYSTQGRSRLDHSGSAITCYNYDNLWYNQPEVFPLDVPYEETFKANSFVPLYLNAPFYIERSVVQNHQQFLGAFLDNTGQSFFALKNESRDPLAVEAGVQHGEFDCHYMFAEHSADVLDAYTYLMGRGSLDTEDEKTSLNRRAVMPPKYLFGYFQAKYGCLGLIRPKEETDPSRVYVDDIVYGHRDAEIPLEGLGVDIDVQEDKKLFTIKDSFWSGGQVGDGVSVFDWAADFNLLCQTNITPFVRADKIAYDPNDASKAQYATAQGLIEKGYCVQNEGETNIVKFRGPENEADYPGLTYTQIGGVSYPDQNVLVLDYGVNAQTGDRDMIGSVVTDFGNPDAARFWGEQYKSLFENGLAFIWQDMTVPDPMPHVEDGQNFADTSAPRNQFGWSLTGEAPSDDRRRTNTFNWRSYHGQLRLTDPRYGDGRKTPFVELRNFHAYMLARSSYEYGLEAHADLLKSHKRSYIICRSGYPGLQHYSGHWIGDNASTWHHLQVSVAQILNLGLSGIPIAGADVGGFAPGEAPSNPTQTFYGEEGNRNHNPSVYDRLVLGPDDIDIGAVSDPELITRWMQAAALQPWARNHYDAMKKYQEIYHYETAATPDGDTNFGDVMAEFVRFRVRWHHLLYDAMYQNTQTGAPLNKAMCLWDQDDAVFDDENRDILATQFFINNSVLVAPILTHSLAGRAGAYEASTDVYFPRGMDGDEINWLRYDVLADKVDLVAPVTGGLRQTISAKIDSLPLFVREGAIIPERHAATDLDAPFKNIQTLDKFEQPLVLSLYPAISEKCSYTYQLYWDDGGISRAAETEGQFSVIDVHHKASQSARVVTLMPARYNFPLHRYIYLRLRMAEPSAGLISAPSGEVGEAFSSRDALFAYDGEGYFAEQATDSLWIKISTADLAANEALEIRVNT